MGINAQQTAVAFSSSDQIENDGNGPINHLPNELMQMIVAKLLLQDGGLINLIQLRLASSRWQAVVEHFCGQRQSLIVNRKSLCCLGAIVNIFAHIEKLDINLLKLDGNEMRNFAAHINSLRSLKKLHISNFETGFEQIPNLSPTLAKLEYIKVDGIYYGEDLHHLVSALGSACVRVYLGDMSSLGYDEISQWHSINPHWLANLTHLQMHINISRDCDQVVRYLSEHATALEYLNYTYEYDCLKISPNVIRNLSKLTKLTDLTFGAIKMDIAELEQASAQQQLISLPSVLNCKLHVGSVLPLNANQFTRLLSVIFPKLAHLHLEFGFVPFSDSMFESNVDSNLDRLSKIGCGFSYNISINSW